MQFPNLMLMKLSHEVMTRQALASADEQFKVQAFYLMAFWMLSKFAEHPELVELQATAVYQPEAFGDEHLIEIQHHLKLTAVGADVGLSDPESYAEAIQSLAPTCYLSEGTFVLTREADLVQEFVAALEQGNDELCEALVHRLASRLVPALGKLRIVHRLNSFM